MESRYSSLRYLRLAGPVIPGRRRNIALSSPVKQSAYPGTSGRGPTKLISPISTFHSSGNSSILYLRNVAPNGVMRLSPATETDDWSVPTRIVRNLYIVNKCPPFPMRFCLYSIGPSGIFMCISSTTVKSSGIVTISPNSAHTRSNIYFNIMLFLSKVMITIQLVIPIRMIDAPL